MTELIWDGKYKDGKKIAPIRIALPYQKIETVNESIQDRQTALDMYAQGRPAEWRNRLIWGDKKYVLPSLLPEFAGKVNLIYIDPPFNVGADFSFTATIPDNPDTEEDETTDFIKQPSAIEQKAYRDTWGKGLDSYLQWFYETVTLLRDFLTEDGSIYVHLDYHIGHYAKAVMDEVFGENSFMNEIVWKRSLPHNDPKKYGSIHDVILYYVKRIALLSSR
jgi:adenine specific DNA methylase Mod